MLKVMTIIGTRPEIIKLSRVIAALDKNCVHTLVHTGQNFDYELNEIFFNDLEIRRPDFFLGAARETPIESIAAIMVETDKVLEKVQPDAVLLYGDTNSCLGVIAAKRRKIPIFHMEAGNRSFDQRVPEEINRKIVDHLADINMPLSEHARKYLEREGLSPDRILKTGSCMKEVFNYYLPKIEKSDALERLHLKAKDYILVSIHREENVDSQSNFIQLVEALNLMAEKFGRQVLVSTHPRTMKMLDKLNLKMSSESVKFLKPFGFIDYICLQLNAFCVVSDSGTITEESSILNFPAVTIRNAHERPEGMDTGAVIMSGTRPKDIMDSIQLAVQTQRPRPIPDYDVECVSEHVVRVIYSYTHFVDRFVWRKMI